MLTIRLTRRGKKNKAFYRIVLAEKSRPIKGKFIESLGFLNPHTKEKKINRERVEFWLNQGVGCSDSIHNLLVSEGILKERKKAIKIQKGSEEKKEEIAKPAETAKTKEREAGSQKEKKS